jgi:hypothetical protein
LERTTEILQQLVLSYSCCHEGSRNPAAPSGSQGSDGTHLHQPWRQVGRKETLDEEEDDAAEEEICLGFLPSPKGALFISNHIVIGLHENKAHKIFTKELNSAHSR